MISRLHGRCAGAFVVATCLTAVGSRAAIAQGAHCDPIATTSIAFGRTGGNIKPEGLLLRADGTLVPGGEATALAPVDTVSRDVVRGLARLGWAKRFTTLPTAPTRPTPNPDAARDFIELRSVCGTKHVEYASGTGAAAFRELHALLLLTASRRAAARQ